MQVRLATRVTSEHYVTGKLWLHATLPICPWHPKGGCGWARHGTYPRTAPLGTRIARWYCPKAGRTVSALPDCLASHRTGTLSQCEACVRALELAPSLESACDHLRTDIELPGAIRYLSRLIRAVHGALRAIKGLYPTAFTCSPTLTDFAALLATPQVLVELRDRIAPHLPFLPTPLGFNPPSITRQSSRPAFQHTMGRDPPMALVDAPD
ncbi:hypothetical protein AB833_28525 [Chromatiales bacterium (ex Bugula neritina AB1)]|nr:hypothetical protein AB833_28525 [Chromatiales bacterium (ex Bugula neritina AB1)]